MKTRTLVSVSVFVAITAWLLRNVFFTAISKIKSERFISFSTQVGVDDPVENVLAACAVMYSRVLVPAPRHAFNLAGKGTPPKESLQSRLFCAVMLGLAAFYWRVLGFSVLAALQIASYIFGIRPIEDNIIYSLPRKFLEGLAAFALVIFICLPSSSDGSCVLSMACSWCWTHLPFLASAVTQTFPVKEFTDAYETTTLFMPDFNTTEASGVHVRVRVRVRV